MSAMNKTAARPSKTVRTAAVAAARQSTNDTQQEQQRGPHHPHQQYHPPTGFISTAIGRVLNPVIDVVDIDGVLQRIDVNEVVSRIDFNAVIDEIDWNNLLDQIDIDALLDRMDVNRVVERVDVNHLIERSNLKQIIARSIDQIVQRTGRCAWCCYCNPEKQKWTIPPRPDVAPLIRWKSKKEDLNERRSMECPRKSSLLAQVVQGRNTGTFSRFLAYSVDKGLTIACSMLIILVATALFELLPQSNDTIAENIPADAIVVDGNVTAEEISQVATAQETAEGVNQETFYFVALGIPIIVVNSIAFVVDALSMATVGRTIGKALMGLVVVNSRNGKVSHITFCQSICRSFLCNMTYFLVWIGALVSLAREDRRGIIDLLCGTTVIYAWDAKGYSMASDELAKENPFGGLDFESTEFDDPEEMERQSGSARGSKRLPNHNRESGINNRSRSNAKSVTIST